MILPILSAVLGIIAFLPTNIYPVAFVFLAPLFIFFIREEKIWRLVLGTVLFQIIFLSGTVYFTLEPILWIEVILTFLGLPIVIWLIKKISIFFFPFSSGPCLLLVLLPFAFTFFDHLQARFALIPTYIMTAGNALGSSSFVGLANVGGLITLTFFVAVINTLFVSLVLNWQSVQHRVLDTKILAFSILTAVLIFSGWQISTYELRKNFLSYHNLPNSFSIAIVSTNDKFTFSSFPELIEELRKQKTDLVVFPEDIFNQPTSSLLFQNVAKELNVYVLAAYDTFENGEKYNTSIFFDAQGNIVGVHNKNRLTFIGEYWPFGNWQPSLYKWLREKNPQIANYAIFSQANAYRTGQQNLLTSNFPSGQVFFATPICLEIQYPNDLQKYKNSGARFIVNQSSNRWIGPGTNHFLYLTNNLRKIEAAWLGLPIIVSGVDDYAGIVLSNGQANLINYENNIKNYSIHFGEVRY